MMNTIDAGIRFLKGVLKLPVDRKNALLAQLYDYRMTQPLKYKGVTLLCCVGEQEKGWLLIDQMDIPRGATVVFNKKEYIVQDVICKLEALCDGTPIKLEFICGSYLTNITD